MKRIEFAATRQRFLPFRTATLIEHALRDARLAPREHDRFRMFCDMIASRFHFEFHSKAEQLKRLYDPLDPDTDTLPANPAEPEPELAELREAFCNLMREGNYVELPRRQILECVELQNYGGLKVEARLDDYLDLAIFYRGVRGRTRSFRRWRRPWRKQTLPCTVLRRAAVFVRTCEQPGRVHLKLFKDIVAEDLEMILPRVRVRMRWVDGLKIASSVAGSLATAAWKALTEALFNPVLFLLMLATFLAAMIRALFAYTTSRSRYMQALSANLYFQNIANNASALACLVDAAETEETKELLLAYFVLYVERDREFTAEELERRVDRWVRDEFAAESDFEARHAIGKLVEMGLAVQRVVPGDAEGTPCRRVLKVYDIPSALRRLDRAWGQFYPYSADGKAEDDRLADGTWPCPDAVL